MKTHDLGFGGIFILKNNLAEVVINQKNHVTLILLVIEMKY